MNIEMRELLYKANIFLIFFFATCGNQPTIIYETIRPPLNLTVTNKSSYLVLTFQSNNSESEFDGFGIFVDTSRSAVEQRTQQDYACPFVPSGMASLTVYMGSSFPSGGNCSVSLTSLPTGFIAVRGHVNRDKQQWSPPAIAAIP